jgi:hypothetical protein
MTASVEETAGSSRSPCLTLQFNVLDANKLSSVNDFLILDISLMGDAEARQLLFGAELPRTGWSIF